MRASEPEIPFPFFDFSQILTRLGPDFGIRDVLKLLLYDLLPQFLGGFAAVVLQILLQCQERIGMAAVFDLPCLAKPHESVPGAPGPIAGGAKAGDVAQFQEPVDDLVAKTIPYAEEWKPKADELWEKRKEEIEVALAEREAKYGPSSVPQKKAQ